jgi:hypothetical protein
LTGSRSLPSRSSGDPSGPAPGFAGLPCEPFPPGEPHMTETTLPSRKTFTSPAPPPCTADTPGTMGFFR